MEQEHYDRLTCIYTGNTAIHLSKNDNKLKSSMAKDEMLINARRMREGYCSHPVCLCVCYRPSADIRRVCDKIGLPVYSSLHAKGFKLSVFAKKPSISSSSLFSLRTAERAVILKQ